MQAKENACTKALFGSDLYGFLTRGSCNLAQQLLIMQWTSFLPEISL